MINSVVLDDTTTGLRYLLITAAGKRNLLVDGKCAGATEDMDVVLRCTSGSLRMVSLSLAQYREFVRSGRLIRKEIPADEVFPGVPCVIEDAEGIDIQVNDTSYTAASSVVAHMALSMADKLLDLDPENYIEMTFLPNIPDVGEVKVHVSITKDGKMSPHQWRKHLEQQLKDRSLKACNCDHG